MHSDQNHSTFPLMMLMEYDASFQIILETFSNSSCCISPSKVALKWFLAILAEFKQLAKNLTKTLAKNLEKHLAKLQPFSREFSEKFSGVVATEIDKIKENWRICSYEK